jgi:hypothetical protein
MQNAIKTAKFHFHVVINAHQSAVNAKIWENMEDAERNAAKYLSVVINVWNLAQKIAHHA